MHPVFFAELQFYDMLIASDSLSHATANNTLRDDAIWFIQPIVQLC